MAFLLWFLMLAVVFGLMPWNERKNAEGDEAADRRSAAFNGILHLLLLLMVIDMIWKPGFPLMHPIERLRYVARASGADQAMLVRETAGALAAFADDPAGLVTACRRIVARHPGSGPLWWLCSRVLTATEPMREAWTASDELDEDRTGAALARALPEDATVCVIGWPDLVGEALRRRGDLDVLVVDALGEGSGLVRVLERSDVVVTDVPVTGTAAAAAAADLVLLEAMRRRPGGGAGDQRLPRRGGGRVDERHPRLAHRRRGPPRPRPHLGVHGAAARRRLRPLGRRRGAGPDRPDRSRGRSGRTRGPGGGPQAHRLPDRPRTLQGAVTHRCPAVT